VWIALAAAGGLLAGSLLNLVIDRFLAPDEDSSAASPPAARDVGSRVRYVLVALAGVALAVAVVLVRHGAHDVALGLALAAVLVPVTAIDLQRRIIPNRITGPAALAAVAIGLATHPAGVATQLIAGIAAGAVLLLFALAYRGALGMGDVKLAGVLGLYLGSSVIVALVAGVLAGGLAGMAVIARLGVSRGRRASIPYGPFLALGGVVGILAGPSIVNWYVH
jgi:leader peptidase (prepilin peptidase) / N-methyltransferase